LKLLLYAINRVHQSRFKLLDSQGCSLKVFFVSTSLPETIQHNFSTHMAGMNSAREMLEFAKPREG